MPVGKKENTQYGEQYRKKADGKRTGKVSFRLPFVMNIYGILSGLKTTNFWQHLILPEGSGSPGRRRSQMG